MKHTLRSMSVISKHFFSSNHTHEFSLYFWTSRWGFLCLHRCPRKSGACCRRVSEQQQVVATWTLGSPVLPHWWLCRTASRNRDCLTKGASHSTTNKLQHISQIPENLFIKSLHRNRKRFPLDWPVWRSGWLPAPSARVLLTAMQRTCPEAHLGAEMANKGLGFIRIRSAKRQKETQWQDREAEEAGHSWPRTSVQLTLQIAAPPVGPYLISLPKTKELMVVNSWRSSGTANNPSSHGLAEHIQAWAPAGETAEAAGHSLHFQAAWGRWGKAPQARGRTG